MAAVPLAGAMPPAGAAKAPQVRSYGEEMPDMVLAYLQRKTNALAAEWDHKRAQIRSAAALEERNRFVRARAIEMIHGLPDRTPLNPAIVRVLERDDYRIESLMFESRPNFWVTASLYVSSGKRTGQRGGRPGIRCPLGTGAAREHGGLDRRARNRRNKATTRRSKSPGAHPHVNDGETIMQYMAWEMNEPLTGMRVKDVLRSIDYVLTRSDVDRAAVRAIGTGMGALWVLFAAALDSRISRAVCDGGLLSYRTLASSDRYLHGSSIMISDVLKHFDLPQVASAIGERRLTLLDPVDAMKARAAPEAARAVYPPPVRIATRKPEVPLSDQYLQLFG